MYVDVYKKYDEESVDAAIQEALTSGEVSPFLPDNFRDALYALAKDHSLESVARSAGAEILGKSLSDFDGESVPPEEPKD